MLSEDNDPNRPDGDHQQRRAKEQVGRDREQVSGFTEAAQVADRDQDDREDAEDDALVDQLGNGRGDLLDR